MKSLKKQVLNYCHQLIDEKLNKLNAISHELFNATNNETKSSVGDKHETGRVMMQLEQEKLGTQIKEWETQKNILQKIDLNKHANTITLGSLIETNNGYFFIAANIGKINIDALSIMVISMQSPLGNLFLNKKPQDNFKFNNTGYLIKKIA